MGERLLQESSTISARSFFNLVLAGLEFEFFNWTTRLCLLRSYDSARFARSVRSPYSVFRIGRTQEFMRAISKSSTIKDAVLRYLQIARSLSLALWLSNDMLVWFHSIGFRQYPNIAQISTRANRFWLGGALCGVAQDVYKLRGNAAAIEKAAQSQARGELGKDGGKKELESLTTWVFNQSFLLSFYFNLANNHIARTAHARNTSSRRCKTRSRPSSRRPCSA